MNGFFLRTFLQEGSQTLQEIFKKWFEQNILFCASILARTFGSKCCFGLAYRALAGARSGENSSLRAYLYKAIDKRSQNIGNDREEPVRRTKVCGSAIYLTDKSSRAARPSKARRIGFIFSLTHLPEKFFVRAQERSRSWRNFFQKVSRIKNNYDKL